MQAGKLQDKLNVALKEVEASRKYANALNDESRSKDECAKRKTDSLQESLRDQEQIARARFGDRFREMRERLVSRTMVRQSKTKIVCEWKNLLASCFLRQAMLKYALGRVDRSLKKRTWKTLKFRINAWRRALRATRVAYDAFVKQGSRKITLFFSAWQRVCQIKHSAHESVLKIVCKGLFFFARQAWQAWVDISHEQRRLRLARARILSKWNLQRSWAPFHTWLSFTVDNRRLRQETWTTNLQYQRRFLQLLELAYQKENRRAKSRVFHAWKASAHKQQQLTRKARSIVSKMLNRTLAVSFRAWCEHSSQQKRMMKVCSKIIKRMSNQELFAAYFSWRENAAEQKSSKAKTTKIIWRILKFRLAVVLDSWRSQVAGKRKMKAKSVKIIQRWMNQGIAATFDNWRANAVDQKGLKNMSKMIVLRILHRSFALAFDTWREHTAELKMLRQKMQKLIMRWVNAVLVVAFDRWFEHLREKNALKTKALKVLQRFLNLHLIRSFEQWKSNVDEMRQLKNRATKVIHRLMGGVLSKALGTWREHIQENQMLQKSASKVVARFMKSSMARSFAAWCSWTGDERHLRHCTSKVINRLLNNNLVLAWDTWLQKAHEEKHMKEKCTKLLRHWLNIGLSRLFATWREHSVKQIRMQATCSQIVMRMRNASTSTAFSTWQDCAQAQQHMRCTCLAVIKRLQSRSLAMALDTWRLNAGKLRDVHERGSKVVLHMLNNNLARALWTWRQNVAINVKHIDRSLKSAHLLAKFLSWKKKAHLLTIFLSWKFYKNKQRSAKWQLAGMLVRQQVIILHQAFGRMKSFTTIARVLKMASVRTNKLLSVLVNPLRELAGYLKAWIRFTAKKSMYSRTTFEITRRLQKRKSTLFQKWRENATKLRRLKDQMTWVVRKLVKGHLISAFDRWQIYATETKQLKNKGLKVIRRMMKTFVYSALARWKERVTQDRQARRRTLKVVQRLMKATIVCAYVRWRENIVEEKQMKSKALKVVQRLMNRALVEGFERWRDQTAEEKQMKAKQKAIEKIKAFLSCKFRHERLVSSFNSWVNMERVSRHVAAGMYRFIRKWISRTLLGAWHNWLDTVDRHRSVRKLGLTIITRWRLSNLWRTFETWHLIINESKRQHIRLDRKYRLIQRWANVAMVGALDTWAWVTACHNKQRQSATKILARWQHSCALGAFAGWLENVNAAQQNRVFILQTRSVQTWTKNQVFRAFNLFKERVSSAVRQRALMARIAQRWMLAAIIGAWNTWIDMTIRSMQIKVIARRVIQRWRLHSLLGALNIWRFVAQRQAKMGLLCKNTLVRLKNRLSFSAMNSWRGNALEHRRLGLLATRAVRKWIMSSLAAVMNRWLAWTIGKSWIKRKAKKGIRRWMNTERAVVFDHWRDHVMQQSSLSKLAARLVLRWRSRTSAQAFLKWVDNVQWMARSKRVLARSLTRWYDHVLHSAWNAWVLNTQKSRKKYHEALVHSLQVWQRPSVGRAWNQWKSQHDINAHFCTVGGRITRRMLHYKLSQGFNTWQGRIAAVKQMSAIMQRVLRRWSFRTLTRVWDLWNAYVLQSHHAREAENYEVEKRLSEEAIELANMTIKSCSHQPSVTTIEDLREHVKALEQQLEEASAREERLLVNNEVLLVDYKVLAAKLDFQQGLCNDEKLKSSESAASAMAASAVSVRQLMDNLRMITLNVDRDFDAWKPADAHSLADTLAKAAGVADDHVKILDCQRGSVIASTVIMAPDWSAVSAKLKILLMDKSGPFKDMGIVGVAGLMGGVVGKPPMPAAAAAAASEEEYEWEMLTNCTPHAHQAAAGKAVAQHDRDDPKKEEHFTRLLRTGRGMPKLKAFNAWHHVHNLMMHFKRVLRRMHKIQLASAFARFFEIVDRLKRHEYGLGKCRSLWLNRRSTHAFQKWQAVHQHSRRIQYVVSQAVRRIYWHTYERYYDHWRELALHLKAARGRMVRHLRLSIHRQLKATFFTWAATSMEMIQVKTTVLRQQRNSQDKERRLHKTAMRIFLRGLCRLLHFAFLRWHQVTVEIRKFLAAGRKIVVRGQQAARGRMLKRWVVAANVQQQARRRWRSLLAMRSLVALQVHAYVLVVIVGACTILIFDVMQLCSLF
jgi:hypothetical protein